MINLFCVGINHRTAPVEVREKLWFSVDEAKALISSTKQQKFSEAVLVSTCNRTELYFVPKGQYPNGMPMWQTLSALKHASGITGEEHFYHFASHNAVRHLLRVSSGLDSLVLGDVQILGQIKDSFKVSQELSATGVILNRLFNKALHVGKRVRTETELGEGAVSVSYAAAELASKIFEDLSKRSALLIGAGETGKLTTRHLLDKHLGKLVIANRTRERADELVAKLGGTVVDFSSLHSELKTADIVVSAVNAPNYILSSLDIKQAMKLRGNRPLVIIDIGVPRNIDPACNNIDNVFYHDIDALSHIIDLNLAHRKAEIPKAQEIIFEELIDFSNWYNSLQVTPTIQQLRETVEAIRHAEVDKHKHHFSPDQLEEVELLTNRIVNKILHQPMVNLRNGSGSSEQEETQHKLHLLRSLFGLDNKVTHER
ncbi:MAG: glutamyl-tRNA reductase [Bacteroidetes bacterium]|nr:MAG: glutamyl-tRNA reductase [Bacteroidota bacterium]